MSGEPEERKLAAIMFTDMVGYSALSQRDDKLALELLEEHRELLREIFPRFNGTEIKTMGDAFLVEFNSALKAAQCAIEIQRALAKRNADAPAKRQIEVRIGIHIGDVVHRAGDVYGDGVNIASRIEQLANAGGICVSMDVERQIRNVLEARFEKLAPTELKNISVPMDLFRIVLPWERPGTPVAKTQTRPKSTSQKFVPSAIALVLLLIIGIGWWWTAQPRRHSASPAAPSTAPIAEKGVAVLPFENLSEDKANAYFAEGIQDEILTRLATVRDLKVISRTSTAKYQSKPDTLKTVAQELGVSTILEGAVQKAGDKVRVNVQLIDARTDTHRWAKSYDRELKDIFTVESDVSQEIVDALQANLSPSESHALASVGTHDAEAYDLFLRGEYEFHQAESTFAPDAYDRADAFYRQALARDPNFAGAAAGLAYSRLSRHWFLSPLAPPELQEVKSIIDGALALAPNSPETHLALGVFFYFGYRQYENALVEFNRTLDLQPNNTLARQFCAFVYRRRGEWERSLADAQLARELDPRDARIPAEIGATYQALRLWDDAERAGLRALALDPHDTLAALNLLFTRLNATGDIGSARRALAGFPEAIKGRPVGSFRGDVATIIDPAVYLDVIERRFADALQAFEKGPGSNERGHLQQLAGRVALRVLAGEPESAKAAAEEARPLLEARFSERPDDSFAMTELSWVYLALGRNADALRLSRQAADSISIEKDALAGPIFQNGLAQIEARAGAPQEAIKRLRRLLSIPAGQVVSIARLKIDPVWDPIRNRLDFQQLLAGKESVGLNK